MSDHRMNPSRLRNVHDSDSGSSNSSGGEGSDDDALQEGSSGLMHRIRPSEIVQILMERNIQADSEEDENPLNMFAVLRRRANLLRQQSSTSSTSTNSSSRRGTTASSTTAEPSSTSSTTTTPQASHSPFRVLVNPSNNPRNQRRESDLRRMTNDRQRGSGNYEDQENERFISSFGIQPPRYSLFEMLMSGQSDAASHDLEQIFEHINLEKEKENIEKSRPQMHRTLPSTSQFFSPLYRWWNEDHHLVDFAHHTRDDGSDVISNSPLSKLHHMRRKPAHHHWQLRDLIHFSHWKCENFVGETFQNLTPHSMRDEDDDDNEDEFIMQLDDDQMIIHGSNLIPVEFSSRSLPTNSSSRNTQDRGYLYYVNNNQCLMYDISKRRAVPISKLGFKPTCMHVHNNIIALGGNESELSLLDIQAGKFLFKDMSLGGQINNGCHISPHSSSTSATSNNIQIFVGNNDKTIKSVSVHNHRIATSSIQAKSPVNYCSTNSDGSLLASCGDNTETVLYDAKTCLPIGTFSGGYDEAAFSVCFSPNQREIAVGSQEGTVVVWDVRKCGSNTPPLTKLSIHRKNVPKKNQSVRVVKYATVAGNDLLIFSEHKLCFHVVDASKNYSDRECFSIFPPTTAEERQSIFSLWNSDYTNSELPAGLDGSINGFCFSKPSSGGMMGDDERMFLAAGDLGIIETQFDVMKRRMVASGSLC
ncbi:hypothetical protein C9374_009393 [Naegleria lovaniensis]|uniref:DUF2415 domain-containing protein n=1 Tax=Naegleria lovaniensis TaxID=51637 RepID=A0AA88GDL1_NAELO|nr:uncharacterized protein C9374_009393 [Naegleria lovaniensis]KAG2377482.1 hypothetical protein C9374_009393 [Naegleria lovaniensis]